VSEEGIERTIADGTKACEKYPLRREARPADPACGGSPVA